MTTVRFRTEDRTTRVDFPYDAELIALLKDVVPRWARSYEPSTKTWIIRDDCGVDVRGAIERAGHVVLDGDDPPPAAASLEDFFGIDDAYDAKTVASDILNDIPAQHHGKVFRAMAKQMYPDLYRR